MPNFNRVMLMGNLTRDPELRYTTGGAPVCDLGLAINRKWKDKSGETKDEVCFVTVVTWAKQAEACGGYLKKGDPVFVEGRLQSKAWETEAKEKRTKLEVVADRVEFLLPKRAEVDNAPDEGTPEATKPEVAEEDIPF